MDMPVWSIFPPSPNLTLLVCECRIVPSATFPTHKNTPIIMIKRKTGLVVKRILRHSILLQYTCSVAYSMRARRWLSVNLTHTTGRQAYRFTALTQFRTVCVEIVVPVAERKCCRSRVVFMFGVFEPLSLNNDLHWVLLHIYDLATIFCLHFQSPKTCSKPWKSHFGLLQWLLLLWLVFGPLLADQQLRKLLIGFNGFIKASHT